MERNLKEFSQRAKHLLDKPLRFSLSCLLIGSLTGLQRSGITIDEDDRPNYESGSICDVHYFTDERTGEEVIDVFPEIYIIGRRLALFTDRSVTTRRDRTRQSSSTFIGGLSVPDLALYYMREIKNEDQPAIPIIAHESYTVWVSNSSTGEIEYTESLIAPSC
jgi:hypothetical protein